MSIENSYFFKENMQLSLTCYENQNAFLYLVQTVVFERIFSEFSVCFFRL